MGHTLTGAPARRSIHHRRQAACAFPPAAAEPVTVSAHGVGVPRRQEVEFADGTRIWLLRVDHVEGVPDLFLRDLGAPAAGARVDLRDLVPEISRDLPLASTRDVPGIVHFSLRGRFKSVRDLLQAAVDAGRPA